jgi:hypothetical protein
MRIPLERWVTLDQKRDTAIRSIQDIERELEAAFWEHHSEGHVEEAQLLRSSLLPLVAGARAELERLAVKPVSEYQGGDLIEGPSFRVKEPHCVPAPRSYL